MRKAVNHEGLHEHSTKLLHLATRWTSRFRKCFRKWINPFYLMDSYGTLVNVPPKYGMPCTTGHVLHHLPRFGRIEPMEPLVASSTIRIVTSTPTFQKVVRNLVKTQESTDWPIGLRDLFYKSKGTHVFGYTGARGP